jgi:hypothetical protein
MPTPPHDQMLSRIKQEVVDGFDEELELEIEDRAGEDVLAGDHPQRADAEQSQRQHYFRSCSSCRPNWSSCRTGSWPAGRRW